MPDKASESVDTIASEAKPEQADPVLSTDAQREEPGSSQDKQTIELKAWSNGEPLVTGRFKNIREAFDWAVKTATNNTLQDLDMSWAELSGLNFSGKTFKRITFLAANLSGSVFSDCKFVNCRFSNSILKDTQFLNVDMAGCNFFGCLLNNGRLKTCNISNSTFVGADLKECKVSESLFSECNFGSNNLAMSAVTSNSFLSCMVCKPNGERKKLTWEDAFYLAEAPTEQKEPFTLKDASCRSITDEEKALYAPKEGKYDSALQWLSNWVCSKDCLQPEIVENKDGWLKVVCPTKIEQTTDNLLMVERSFVRHFGPLIRVDWSHECITLMVPADRFFVNSHDDEELAEGEERQDARTISDKSRCQETVLSQDFERLGTYTNKRYGYTIGMKRMGGVYVQMLDGIDKMQITIPWFQFVSLFMKFEAEWNKRFNGKVDKCVCDIETQRSLKGL